MPTQNHELTPEPDSLEALLRAIDEGESSGIAHGNVFEQVRRARASIKKTNDQERPISLIDSGRLAQVD